MEPCRICFQFIGKSDHKPQLKTLCKQCWTSKIIYKPVSEWLAIDNSYGINIASCVTYSGAIRDLIHRLKYQNDPVLAHDLSHLIVHAWPMILPMIAERDVVLIPIPLSKKRLASRGYNQAELICRHAAQHLHVKYTHALTRIKETKPQFGLSRAERQDNLQSAFRGNADEIRDKVVVLIDDIYTSGSTLAAAAKEVHSCGATKVLALTIARAEKHLPTGESKNARDLTLLRD
jgi:ComF family protein